MGGKGRTFLQEHTKREVVLSLARIFHHDYFASLQSYVLPYALLFCGTLPEIMVCLFSCRCVLVLMDPGVIHWFSVTSMVPVSAWCPSMEHTYVKVPFAPGLKVVEVEEVSFGLGAI